MSTCQLTSFQCRWTRRPVFVTEKRVGDRSSSLQIFSYIESLRKLSFYHGTIKPQHCFYFVWSPWPIVGRAVCSWSLWLAPRQRAVTLIKSGRMPDLIIITVASLKAGCLRHFVLNFAEIRHEEEECILIYNPPPHSSGGDFFISKKNFLKL